MLLRCATISLLLCIGCAHAPRTVFKASPAAPDSTTTTSRQWSLVTVSGSYGTFDIPVPVLAITPAAGNHSTLLVDSVALREVERRVTARIARIARAEAAALRDTTPPMMPPRTPAPAIQPGLLGTVTFEADSAKPSSEGLARIAAVAHLAAQIPGRIELIAHVEGTGGPLLDAAMLRARSVYLALLRAEPSLGQREVVLTVQTHIDVPGAPRQPATVQVFAAGAR
jgi:hypothetical protein